jgi:hypothetical protein
MGLLTDVASISSSMLQGTVRSNSNDREFSRLISAAVVNKNFCNLLLNNPKRALSTGFQGETFSFGHEEENLIVSIEATTLADFATQLTNHESIERLRKDAYC